MTPNRIERRLPSRLFREIFRYARLRVATRDLKTGSFFAILGYGEMEMVRRMKQRRSPRPNLSFLPPGRREKATADRRSPV